MAGIDQTRRSQPADHSARTTVFADVNDDLVLPPVPRPAWVRWLPWIAVFTVVVVAAAGSLLYIERQQDEAEQQRLYAQTLCPGLSAKTGPGFGLELVDGECVGWTIEEPYHFAPGKTDSVIDDIARLNRNVDKARPYARVAVLMPMTGGDQTMMTSSTIRTSLKGVATAISRANSGDSSLGTATLQFQAVLVSEGSNGTSWSKALTEALDATNQPEHPVVAVTGLGASTPESRKAIDYLGEHDIPTITAALTATDLGSSTSLFHVSASNEQTALALNTYLDTRPLPSKPVGVVMYDRKEQDDPFLESLHSAIRQVFSARFRSLSADGRSSGLDANELPFDGQREVKNGLANVLQDIKYKVCNQRPDVVFFSGRTRDLDVLVPALADDPDCRKNAAKPVVILTEGPGRTEVINDAEQPLVDQLKLANISVVMATSIDSTVWEDNGVDTPPFFPQFLRAYQGLKYFDDADDDLADGYAILNHDTVVTAIWAARRLLEGQGSTTDLAILSARTVRNHMAAMSGKEAVPAAGGTLSFDDNSPMGAHGRPHNKSLTLVQTPGGAPIKAYFTP